MKKKIVHSFDMIFDITMLGAGVFVYFHEGVITCMAFFGMLIYLKLCEINTSLQSNFVRLQRDEKAK